MIDIVEKSKCCGCEACKNICPQKCIIMKEDEEGFRYPVIDQSKCVDCGLCKHSCPQLEEPKKENILEKNIFFAAYNKNDEILKTSSSGGIFWILVEWVLERKGVVYGVLQNDTYKVNFVRAENKAECEKLRGSKYLQAEVNQIYSQVKEDLENEKSVLFSGTPCQVAALYKFLNKDYENLYTVDVVCHGVPSNKVYREYINFVEKKNGKKVINIKWRNKKGGWGPNKITIFFDDGSEKTSISRENPFQVGFLENIYLRQSCYECKYARLPRIADISLADFWGYDQEFVKQNKNKGLSIVIVASEKGKRIFEIIKDNMYFHEVDEQYVKSKSRHVYIHPLENTRRAQFFIDLNKMDFNKISKKYKMQSGKIKTILKKIKRKIIK